MISDHCVLKTAEMFLHSVVALISESIDHDSQQLFSTFSGLGNHALLGLRIPQRWGGAAVTEPVFCYFQELVARYSGALAFLQAQHQSAGSLLARSQNVALQQAYLPGMSTGAVRVGISFSHLRRSPSPLKAVSAANGYHFWGQAPWVTGWGCFQYFVVAALLPDEQVVYALVPFQTQQQEAGDLVCSQPMMLAAMTATNTVSVEFTNWFVANDHVVSVKPVTAIAMNDRLNVLQHSFFALGCAQAGLDILQAAQVKRSVPAIAKIQAILTQELQGCRQAIYLAQTDTPDFAAKLALRATAIELAGRCAHAAVIAAGGAANNINHPAQRVFREAMIFSVSGQTTAVMEASLEQLAHKSDKFSITNNIA
jgi:alkylation response protein AidB-like acyl-CoA dehydrogenase